MCAFACRRAQACPCSVRDHACAMLRCGCRWRWRVRAARWSGWARRTDTCMNSSCRAAPRPRRHHPFHSLAAPPTSTSTSTAATASMKPLTLQVARAARATCTACRGRPVAQMGRARSMRMRMRMYRRPSAPATAVRAVAHHSTAARQGRAACVGGTGPVLGPALTPATTAAAAGVAAVQAAAGSKLAPSTQRGAGA